MADSLKRQVRDYWQQDPCGSKDASPPLATRETRRLVLSRFGWFLGVEGEKPGR